MANREISKNLSTGVIPIIFVLYSKDLLAIVLLLIILLLAVLF